MSRLFLLLAMLLVSGSIQTSPAVTMDKLHESWKLYMDECERNNTRAPPSAVLVCNRTFDKYACWPDGLPNTTVSVSCPWYLPWYHKVQHGLVYQECDANGQWLTMKNTSECDSNNPSQQYYGHIRIMYTVGYSLSLVALVLALSILIFFRKLHCMRNNIHMNLFASFILRALSILIKDALMEANITSQDLSRDQEQGLSRASVSPVDLLVNNEVLGPEYKHELLVDHTFAHTRGSCDQLPDLHPYHQNSRVQTESASDAIHRLQIQVVFIYVTDEATETTIGLRLTKLVIDLFFSSFQGLLVAILYCFVNKEVQSEVLKKWKRWKLGRHIEEEYRHTYSNTPNTKTASLLNHVSQRTPRLADAPAEPSTPVCGPEERHALVANGEAAGRQEGAIGDRPPAEDAGLPDGAESERAESRH
ncbi:glucagon receptor isoform X2 [Phyllopteryx taeniolatus]|uniref:glucagon receptor isoform X2 n=1 Tax=Phyllopteryx taeniolatus TaxID=161469 RepID=UPI002AD34FE5|nr:glucagon receptor isoform X2 [Phyllopteryx taeniolatus]